MPAYVTNWTQPANRRYLFAITWCPTVVSLAAGAAGRCFCALLEVTEAQRVEGMYLYNFATVAGNCRVGIYKQATEDALLNSTLVATSADTALAGANQYQYVAFTAAVTLSPGRYYVASIFSDATHTVAKPINAVFVAGQSYYYDRGGGYGAFTDPAPAGTATTSTAQMITRVNK